MNWLIVYELVKTALFFSVKKSICQSGIHPMNCLDFSRQLTLLRRVTQWGVVEKLATDTTMHVVPLCM